MTLLDADLKDRRNVVGEDTYELFATIEDSFGVSFSDYEAIQGKSVLELAERIANESTYPKADRCLSSVAFYKLRLAFQEQVGAPRSKIRPSTPLLSLLPWSQRRDHWRRLQEQLGLDFPALTLPLWLVASSLAVAVALSLALSAATKALLGSGLNVMNVVILSFCIWIFVTRLLLPLGRDIPKGCETFGGLVKTVLARNYATFASRYGNAPLDEVASLLCQLIAVEVGLSPAAIKPTTSIPGDLDID
jgi:hypothetical protein